MNDLKVGCVAIIISSNNSDNIGKEVVVDAITDEPVIYFRDGNATCSVDNAKRTLSCVISGDFINKDAFGLDYNAKSGVISASKLMVIGGDDQSITQTDKIHGEDLVHG